MGAESSSDRTRRRIIEDGDRNKNKMGRASKSGPQRKRGRGGLEDEPLIAQSVVRGFRTGDLPVEVLGSGSYGTVYAVTTEDGHKYALKVFKQDVRDDVAQKNFEREVAALKEFQDECKSNHIVCFVDAMKYKDPRDASNNRYYILTKLLENHKSLIDLWPEISKKGFLTEEKAKRAVTTFIMAMITLQRHEWVHNDLGYRNLMMDEQGNTVLIDMGLAVPEGQSYTRLRPVANMRSDRKEARDIVQDLLFYTRYEEKEQKEQAEDAEAKSKSKIAQIELRKRQLVQSLPEVVRQYLSTVMMAKVVPLVPAAPLPTKVLELLETVLADEKHGAYALFRPPMIAKFYKQFLLETADQRASFWFALLRIFFASEEKAHVALAIVLQKKGSPRHAAGDQKNLKAFFKHLPDRALDKDDLAEAKKRFNEAATASAEDSSGDMLMRRELLNLRPANADDDISLLSDLELRVPDPPMLTKGSQENKYKFIRDHYMHQAHATALILASPYGNYVASLFCWPSTNRPGYLVLGVYSEAATHLFDNEFSQTGLALCLLRSALEYATDLKAYQGVYMDRAPKHMKHALESVGFTLKDDRHEIPHGELARTLTRTEEKLQLVHMDVQLHHTDAKVQSFQWPWEGLSDSKLAQVFDRESYPSALRDSLTDLKLAVLVRRHPYYYMPAAAKSEKGQVKGKEEERLEEKPRFHIPPPSVMYHIE